MNKPCWKHVSIVPQDMFIKPPQVMYLLCFQHTQLSPESAFNACVDSYLCSSSMGLLDELSCISSILVCVCDMVSGVPGIPLFYAWVTYHRGGYIYLLLDFNPPQAVSWALLDSGCPVVCLAMNMHEITKREISYMCTCDYFLIWLHK